MNAEIAVNDALLVHSFQRLGDPAVGRPVSLAAAAVLLLTLCLPSRAAAQDRKGFWIGAGVGLGSAGPSADGPGRDRGRFGVVNIDLGWTLSQRSTPLPVRHDFGEPKVFRSHTDHLAVLEKRVEQQNAVGRGVLPTRSGDFDGNSE